MNIRNQRENKPKRFYAFHLISISFLLMFYSCQRVEIEKEEIGVKFKRFKGGIDTDKIYKHGTYFVYNWDYIIVHNIEPKVIESEIEVFKEDLYKIKLHFSLKYSLNKQELGMLQLNIGENYGEVLKANIRRLIFEKFNNLSQIKLEREDLNLKEKQILEELKNKFKIQYFDFEYFRIDNYEVLDF